MKDKDEERLAIISGDFNVGTPGVGTALDSRISWKPGEDPKEKEKEEKEDK